MLRKFGILLFFICTINISYGQLFDSKGFFIEDENKEVLIESRKFIYSLLETFKLKKAKIEIQKLDSLFQKSETIPFRTLERWMLAYWTMEYDLILNQCLIFDSLYSKNQFKVPPPHDILAKLLKFNTANNIDILLDSLEIANLNQSDKEFLKLTLFYILNEEEKIIISRDSLNKISTNYIQKYPGIKYEKFIRENIRFIYKNSDFSSGFGFYSGYAIHTYNLNEYMNNFGLLSIGYNFIYLKYYASLKFNSGFPSKIKKEIKYNNTTWVEGTTLYYFQPQIDIGYIIFNSNKIKLIPYISASLSGYLPPSSNPDYEGELIGPEFNMCGGIIFNQIFSNQTSLIWENKIKSEWSINYNLGFTNSLFNNTNSKSTEGAVIYLLIGISNNRSISKRIL